VTLNHRQWRFICDEPAFGRWNMAVDEAILNAVGSGTEPPTLRLYGWEPACLSLGVSQAVSDVDGASVAAQRWDIVRRPTGGRAILHTDELTYSLSVPADHELAKLDIIGSYRKISTALMIALERLGANPKSERRTEPAIKKPNAVCFETPSHYEITSGGRKLVGSAQMRRKAGLLQHGTLPLFGDVARICDALSYDSEDERETAKITVRQRAATLAAVLGRLVTWDEAAAAVADGFRTAFDIELTESTLSVYELEDAASLEAAKYGTADHIYAR
jgi:lipoate-protein ligase A